MELAMVSRSSERSEEDILRYAQNNRKEGLRVTRGPAEHLPSVKACQTKAFAIGSGCDLNIESAHQTQEYTGGNSGADNPSHIGAHGMHQEEISWVCFLSHPLHHSS